ncbi:MAG: methylated-DNA--protein-cysteine methyltransferase [Ramlibacter sp.]|jgi:methylated-DNA-[protein]-cysteine S-methyltransferase|nr:methylated-DNA--protein-cysteine methyltransferase [Ramlibacter sp.]
MPDADFTLFATAIGCCGIAWGERALIGVQLPESTEAGTRARLLRGLPELSEAEAPPWVLLAIARIQALLNGAQDDLADIPLDMDRVSPFHQRVYEITRAIPPGRTLTYGDVAQRLGDPGAARAVGQALGHNPFAPVVPCHRVLAARGAGGGFSAEGGVATKLRMLQIEKAQMGPERGLFD